MNLQSDDWRALALLPVMANMDGRNETIGSAGGYASRKFSAARPVCDQVASALRAVQRSAGR